jgi:hypothetical protein
MLIGQSLIAPADGTHKVFGPWLPRQGDKFTAVVEVIRTSNIGGGTTLQVAYQTKNQEDADNAVVGTIGSAVLTAITAPITASFACSGCKELVRCVYEVSSASGTDEWIHLRSNPPVWQSN